MENKNLIYIVGGIAVVGIGYYLYTKRKSATPQQAPVNTNVKDADVTAEETEPKEQPIGKPKERPIGKPKNPMASETITAVGTSIPPASTQPKASTPASTKTQLGRLEVEKRIFTACGIKPTGLFAERRNKWDECKDRTKANLKAQGLISFSGDRYSNMSSDFDISFR
jgi:hypothetical protein